MPRPKRPIRPVLKNISLPEDLVAQIDLQLFSELEARVPHGAWSRLMEGLLREWLTKIQISTAAAQAVLENPDA